MHKLGSGFSVPPLVPGGGTAPSASALHRLYRFC